MPAAIPIIAAVAGAVVSSALAPKPQSAPAQAPQPMQMPQSQNTGPTVMPGANDKSIAEAQRRSVADQVARRGRASTILTGDLVTTPEEKLGG